MRTPEYNTRVTVTSCLSSEKYEGYYERYRDDESIDPAVLAKYKALSRQEVSATFTVVGTTGRPDPEAGRGVTVSARVVGVSEPGEGGSVREETWIPLRGRLREGRRQDGVGRLRVRAGRCGLHL